MGVECLGIGGIKRCRVSPCTIAVSTQDTTKRDYLGRPISKSVASVTADDSGERKIQASWLSTLGMNTGSDISYITVPFSEMAGLLVERSTLSVVETSVAPHLVKANTCRTSERKMAREQKKAKITHVAS